MAERTRSRSHVSRTAAATLALALGASLVVPAAPVRFYPDDPLWRDDDTVEDASGVTAWNIPDAYTAAENTFGEPGDDARDVRARNVNTLDEVPDSSWFTNRVGRRLMSGEEIAAGGWASEGPVEGRWIVIDGKSDGVSPGFTVTDPAGARWFLKFDADEHPGMASGSEVASSRLLWALGYNVPEYHVVGVRRDRLTVGEGARVQPPGAFTRMMRDSDIDLLLRDAARNPDGTYRAVASRGLPGTPLGGFRFHGVRPDDPNDIVPHEHRRELRGLLVFSAWLNHVEVRSGNTLDTLVEEGGRRVVRHHLLDFGATLGSGTLSPRDYWEGFEYLVDVEQAVKGIASFGFYIQPWRTVPFHESPNVGRVPAEVSDWDPATWRPRFANAAFRHARADDRFWAATKLLAIDESLIRAAVRDGAFPADEDVVIRTLMDRRRAILARDLVALTPVADAALDAGGRLTFVNVAVKAGVAAAPSGYRAAWHRFDNATGATTPIGESTGTDPALAVPGPLPAEPGAILLVQIAADSAEHPRWGRPVSAYFRRASDGTWQTIGLERLPAGSASATK